MCRRRRRRRSQHAFSLPPLPFGAYCAVSLQLPKGIQPNPAEAPSSLYSTYFSPRMISFMLSRKPSGGPTPQHLQHPCHRRRFRGCHLRPSFCLEILMQSIRFRGQHAAYPVKLFYTRMCTSLVRRLLMKRTEAWKRNLAFHLRPYCMSPSVLYQHTPPTPRPY